MTIPNLRCGPCKDIHPKDESEGFRAYSRAQQCQLPGTWKLAIESRPVHGWFSQFRVTVCPEDKTGLTPAQVQSVLELLPGARMTMFELSWDFALTSRVTPVFVRKHGLFGKALRNYEVKNPEVNGDKWGSRRGWKLAKSYTKHSVASHRLELELQSRFLRWYSIRTIFDFQSLPALLLNRHIFLGKLDEARLMKTLTKCGRSEVDIRRIADGVKRRQADLCATLKFLRLEGLTNLRRLLVALRENEMLKQALERWAAAWPTAPRKLINEE